MNEVQTGTSWATGSIQQLKKMNESCALRCAVALEGRGVGRCFLFNDRLENKVKDFLHLVLSQDLRSKGEDAVIL